MIDCDKPLGQRFSQLYLECGLPQSDSPRMRRRLAALVRLFEPENLWDQLDLLGIKVPYSSEAPLWDSFFQAADLGDVLDTITVAYKALARTDAQFGESNAATLVTGVNAIFREENLHYEVDEQGGVHHSVDAEFARNRVSTLAGLGSSRHANVAKNFETAQASLSSVPSDGRAAIRSIFDAAEGLFKLMFRREPRLTVDAAGQNLRPMAQRRYNDNPPATAAASKMVDAFCDWVAACHNYRHEHGQEEVLSPPLDIAVQLVSAGATHLRWLLEMDVQQQSGNVDTDAC